MNRSLLSLLLTSLIFFYACEKNGKLPLVSTLRPYGTDSLEATCGGVIYSEGDDAISEKGICWSTNSPATIKDGSSKTKAGSGAGNFSSKMGNLRPSTKYFVRAYAINKYGTAYGSEESIIITPGAPVPTFIGEFAQFVTENSVIADASVLIAPGQAPILQSGFCWSNSTMPTVADSKIISTPNFRGAFTSTITGLSANTTYTLRAFATNSTGISYGAPTIFKTKFGTMTDIDGNTYYTVKIGNQIWMAENLKVTKYSDGSPIAYATSGYEWVVNASNGAYCYFSDFPQNSSLGALYNWSAVINLKGIAPVGWHVPTEDEFNTLINNLGGTETAGKKLKLDMPKQWPANNIDNSSGFSAIPTGSRSMSGYFSSTISQTFFWSSTTDSQDNIFMLLLDQGDPVKTMNSSVPNGGFSLRLIKD